MVSHGQFNVLESGNAANTKQHYMTMLFTLHTGSPDGCPEVLSDCGIEIGLNAPCKL